MTFPTEAFDPELTRDGPLDRAGADRLLDRADRLLAAGEFAAATRYYQRVVGSTPDPEHTAAALFGLGMSLYRVDQDDAALSTWEQILRLPETSSTYRAYREIAGARVRNGDLAGAQRAYLEAQRRAPPEDRAEIASRLGWLAKETGDSGRAQRYFSRSRGDTAPPYVTYGIIAITVVISLLGFQNDAVFEALQLDKQAVANGEYYRLWSVTLLHGNYLHLFFNMYALFLAGVLVEQLYGPALFAVIYLLAAAAGSVGSYLVGGDVPSVGASGAIFGLFGVLVAVSRTYRPVLDRRGQMLLGQMAGLVVINLAFGFLVPGIDIWAHIGGLLAGLWLGFLLPPTRVQTMGSLWRGSSGGAVTAISGASILRALGIVALVVAIAAGVAIGTQMRHERGPAGRTSGWVPVAVSAALPSGGRPGG
jgi:rhomboid protease GluP